MEVHVRSARQTDLDAAVRLLAHDGADRERGGRRLPAQPPLCSSATVIVAEAERRVVGVGVLAVRRSVRSGPFVGIVDELAIDGGAERRRPATGCRRDRRAPRHLGKNKGCTRIEAAEPLDIR